MSGQPTVGRVARVSFTASDLDATRAFFLALGFAASPIEPVAAADLVVLGLPGKRAERLPLRLGAQTVEFLRFGSPGRPMPADGTSTDLWFQHIAIAVSDIDAAFARATAAGATPITRGGPQVLPPNTGRVAAWKFRDPDGHPLELLHFPPGQGEAVWHRAEGGPFLGIDHTAIAVSDPDRSALFYGDLGLSVAGGSHNAGPEQERLDDVAADRVRVVPLTPPETPPHVELLGYEAGRRRPMPADTRADDIWATRTVLGATALDGPKLRHDPDGHFLLLIPEG